MQGENLKLHQILLVLKRQ